MRSERGPRRKRCERCNSRVPAESTRCPNCRAELPLLPDSVRIEVAPDGRLLSEYANGQLDGVVDPRTRIARLRAIAWDLERSIETGVITYPHQIEHARAFVRAAEREMASYLATQRHENRRAAVPWLRRGLAIVAVGIVLTVATAVTLGGTEAFVIALVAGAVALALLAIAGVLSVRAPRLPYPERRPSVAAAQTPTAAAAAPDSNDASA